MAGEHSIETRNRPGEPWELWATRVGSYADALRSAAELLDEMREAGLTRAAVRIDGRHVRAATLRGVT